MCCAGWGHHNAVSSAGFEPIVTVYVHTHTPMQRSHRERTGQTHLRVCAYKHRLHTNIIASLPPSSTSRRRGDIAPYLSSLTNPLVVSQTCVLCFNRGENKHIVEQGFGTAWVCCWILGHSITARTSQHSLGLGCNHREGKERTLSCAIAINTPRTGIINHQ